MTNGTAVATQNDTEMLERVLVGGDLSKLTPAQRLSYYKRVCDSLGLNPLTKPFAYITLNGKLVLYAQRDATDQLRRLHGVSIIGLQESVQEGIFIVKASAKDKTGRTDVATGAVALADLRGVDRANAMMRTETKAKRRVTLSLVGLGWLDETEVEAAGGTPEGIDEATGEIADLAVRSIPEPSPAAKPNPDIPPPGPQVEARPADKLDNLIAEGKVMLTQVRALGRGLFRARLEELSPEQREKLADEISGRLLSGKE